MKGTAHTAAHPVRSGHPYAPARCGYRAMKAQRDQTPKSLHTAG